MITVNPDKFKVPYAISADARIFHIKYGKPDADGVQCPLCRGAVSFVSEGEKRAAHFRHKDKTDCDAMAHNLRSTMHHSVRDAAVEILNGRGFATDICTGQGGIVLPSGTAYAERPNEIDGVKYVPDITVLPKEGQRAAVLELEVIWSHKPTEKRLIAAANDGRTIGVINIARIERDYYQKLWANERFDIPEACKEYIKAERFHILSTADVRRVLRGAVERKYMLAKVAREHAEMLKGRTIQEAYHPPAHIQLAERLAQLKAAQDDAEAAVAAQKAAEAQAKARAEAAAAQTKARAEEAAAAQKAAEARAKKYPHGFGLNGYPKTWTGKAVSFAAFEALSDWERHGPNGRFHCGACQAWVTDCEHTKEAKK